MVQQKKGLCRIGRCFLHKRLVAAQTLSRYLAARGPYNQQWRIYSS
jgi:hypothetical protein